jgi:hypothetical protein
MSWTNRPIGVSPRTLGLAKSLFSAAGVDGVDTTDPDRSQESIIEFQRPPAQRSPPDHPGHGPGLPEEARASAGGLARRRPMSPRPWCAPILEVRHTHRNSSVRDARGADEPRLTRHQRVDVSRPSAHERLPAGTGAISAPAPTTVRSDIWASSPTTARSPTTEWLTTAPAPTVTPGRSTDRWTRAPPCPRAPEPGDRSLDHRTPGHEGCCTHHCRASDLSVL